MQVHLIPILREHSMTAVIAAGALGSAGLATVIGRLIGGFVLDRISGSLVGALIFFLPLPSCLILLQGHIGIKMAVTVAVLMGFAYGAEFHVIAHLSSRYCGLRSYGSSFGLLSGLIGFGAGFGPAAAGAARDHFSSYDPVLLSSRDALSWVRC